MVRLGRAVLALMVLLLATALTHAADFPELVQQLGSDSFSAKVDAVTALGSLGDPRAVRILNALRDDRLYTTTDDNKVVIAAPKGDDFDIFDPINNARIDTVASDKIDRVLVNNRLRNAIDNALAGLNLFSDRPERRLEAADDAMRHPSKERAAALEKALAAEPDAAVRAALARALAASRLASPDKQEQLAAIAALAATADPDMFNLLSEARNAPNLDPDVRHALDSALSAMSRRLSLYHAAATVFEGLSLGSILLLAAIGLAITFGVMGVINMAHGEMIMIGAYATFVVQQWFQAYLPARWFDAYLVAALPVGFLVAGAVGILLERGIIRFLYGRPLETLLATWGVSLILQQAVRSIFGAPNKAVANPTWMTGGFELIGGVTITWNRLVILGFCFAVLGVLALVLKRTSFGLHMRAVTQNRDMAAVMGIRTSRVDALTFGLGSGIAGIAGVALSQIGNVSPNLGTIYIVDSFMVVVLGGVGSLLGTLAGAMSLGIVNKVLEPVAGAVLGKVAVLVLIILFIQKRPRGLFALRGRAAEG
jgi:urea transport system permease protein